MYISKLILLMMDLLDLEIPFRKSWLRQEQGRRIKDKENHHWAMGKLSLEQNFCKSATIIYIV